MDNSLRKLVIKPTFNCFCNCQFCSERQKFYQKQKTKHPDDLQIDTILKTIDIANDMGVNNLQISGGDPLLYKHLDKIIEHAHKYNWFVFINSTGYKLTLNRAIKLVKIGLSAFNTSIDSNLSSIHDSLRRKKNALMYSLKAIDNFNIAKQKLNKSNFFINIQTIINKYNFKSLEKIFELALKKDVSSIYLMYPYNDSNQVITPNINEIKYFQETTINKILNTIKKYRRCGEIYKNSKKILENLFPINNKERNLYKNGKYFDSIKESKKYCFKPLDTLMIVANGDVIPCCTLENKYTTTIGNIYEQSLGEIWNSKKLSKFRDVRNKFCVLCPSSHNKTIGLTTEMLKQF
jgi:pyrroloquinoline quinone biosynthesis protein E